MFVGVMDVQDVYHHIGTKSLQTALERLPYPFLGIIIQRRLVPRATAVFLTQDPSYLCRQDQIRWLPVCRKVAAKPALASPSAIERRRVDVSYPSFNGLCNG